MLQPTAKFLAHTITTVLTLVMVLSASLVVLLARGPISLTFFSPYLARALNDEKSAVHISFDDTVLAWDGRRGRLDIRIIAVRVDDADGRRLATVPQVAVRLRTPALLELRVEPEQLVLIEPRIRLVRNAAGALEIGFGGEGDESGQDILAGWLHGEWPGFTRTLTEIHVREAELSIDDRKTGHLWRAPSADLSLIRSADSTRIVADAGMMIADRPARVSVKSLYVGADRPIWVDLRFSNVEPAILASEAGLDVLAPLAALHMGVSGDLAFTFDAAMALQKTDFKLRAGAGVLSLPEYYGTPLSIAGMTAEGHLTATPEKLRVDRLVVDLGHGRQAEFQGEIVNPEAGLGIQGTASVSGADVTDLQTYWPRPMKPNSRQWVIEHIEQGRLGAVHFTFDVRPGELDQHAHRAGMAVLEFEFRDVTCRYWKALPALKRARGVGRIDAKRLDITIQGGVLDDVAVSEGKLSILHDVPDPQYGEIEFVAQGAAHSMLDILDRKPLELAHKIGIDARSVGGEGAARIRLRLPLEKHIPLEQVEYSASARVHDLKLANALTVYDLTQGEVELTLTRQALKAEGTIALNQVPMSLNWQYDFDPAVSHPSRYGMAAVLDDAARRRLGIHLAPYLGGASRVELQIAKNRAGLFDVRGRADLGAARLALPQLKWSKPAGQEAQADYHFTAGRGRGIEIESFRIASGDFQATGRAEIGETARHVVFDRLRLGDNDFAADVRVAGSGATSVALSGKTLDLRPLISEGPQGQGAPGEAAGEQAATLDLTARLDRVIVFDSYWLQGAEATAERRGGRWRKLDAVGALNGIAAVSVAMVPDGPHHQTLTFSGDDAGGVIAATGYGTGVKGGNLKLVLRIPDGEASDAAVVGKLAADDFRLLDAPLLTKVLTVGSITGINDLLKGQGIQFKHLRVEFEKQGDVVHIKSGRAAGPALGLTLAGTINRGAGRLDLNGAVVPAYTINSALGGIPLFGKLLVGREGEGVFALDYRISGPIDEPVVSVNPLSVLAPGVLRRLVEAFGGPITVEPPDDGQDYLTPDTDRP